jgi:hypothetical protein
VSATVNVVCCFGPGSFLQSLAMGVENVSTCQGVDVCLFTCPTNKADEGNAARTGPIPSKLPFRVPPCPSWPRESVVKRVDDGCHYKHHSLSRTTQYIVFFCETAPRSNFGYTASVAWPGRMSRSAGPISRHPVRRGGGGSAWTSKRGRVGLAVSRRV